MSADKTLVVIGASHAGLGLVDQLKSKLPAGWTVKVIEPNSHFHWQIGSMRAVVDPAFTDKVFLGPLADKFAKLPAFELIQDRVVSVDRQAKTVSLHSGQSVAYTYLVVASGSSSAAVWKTVETEQDPIAAARAELKAYGEAIKSAEHVIVGGAGPVGLEFCGEIKSAYPSKQVTLVDAGATVLPEDLGWHKNISVRYEGFLKKAGVKVIHSTKVVSPAVSSKSAVDVELINGDKLHGLYFAATGVRPRTSFLPAELLTERKYVDTMPTMQAKEDPFIFAVGDASNNTRKVGLVIAGQVGVLVHNFLKLSSDANTPASALQQYGGDTRTFMGFLTFGKGAGVGQISFIRVPSFVVSMLKGPDMFSSMGTKMVA